MNTYSNIFEEMTSAEALFEAWFKFRKGKRERRDVQVFERHLERNLFRLHRSLLSQRYHHGPYHSFYIQDPKVRHIRGACVRDRVVHQAAYTVLSRIFEPLFAHPVYSSRIGRGTHLAAKILRRMTWKAGKNLTQPCWSLKCDIRKFYDSVDHDLLMRLLEKKIPDKNALRLLQKIIESFHHEGTPGKGLPIGNLTSQIFTNIYLFNLSAFKVKESA